MYRDILFVRCVKIISVLCKCLFLFQQKSDYRPDFGIVIPIVEQNLHTFCKHSLSPLPTGFNTKPVVVADAGRTQQPEEEAGSSTGDREETSHMRKKREGTAE